MLEVRNMKLGASRSNAVSGQFTSGTTALDPASGPLSHHFTYRTVTAINLSDPTQWGHIVPTLDMTLDMTLE